METDNENGERLFSKEVGEKEKRMLKARNENKRSVWSGFGLFGIIGWSVVTPTLIGAAIGKWLDNKYPQAHSWTLACLVAGLSVGCYIAWHWIKKEHDEI